MPTCCSAFAVWDRRQRDVAELLALTGDRTVSSHQHRFRSANAAYRANGPSSRSTCCVSTSSSNDRRRAILRCLACSRPSLLRCLYGGYGAQHDRAIADAKVVADFQATRTGCTRSSRFLAHLLANGKAIMSASATPAHRDRRGHSPRHRRQVLRRAGPRPASPSSPSGRAAAGDEAPGPQDVQPPLAGRHAGRGHHRPHHRPCRV